MWIIWKKIGLYEHYLDIAGNFQPKLDAAKKFPSKEMANIIAKQKGGIVRAFSSDANQL